jgi:hypothetical protein
MARFRDAHALGGEVSVAGVELPDAILAIEEGV